MPPCALSAEQLLDWSDDTARRWRSFLAAHPEALQAPCDIAGSKTVAELLRHIVKSELRYAELIAGMPPSDYDHLPAGTVEEIFGLHDSAFGIFHRLLQSAAFDGSGTVEFVTLTQGRRRAGRQDVLFHSVLHGIRHYAQLGTAARQAGYSHSLAVDYLMMASQRVHV